MTPWIVRLLDRPVAVFGIRKHAKEEVLYTVREWDTDSLAKVTMETCRPHPVRAISCLPVASPGLIELWDGFFIHGHDASVRTDMVHHPVGVRVYGAWRFATERASFWHNTICEVVIRIYNTMNCRWGRIRYHVNVYRRTERREGWRQALCMRSMRRRVGNGFPLTLFSGLRVAMVRILDIVVGRLVFNIFRLRVCGRSNSALCFPVLYGTTFRT